MYIISYLIYSELLTIGKRKLMYSQCYHFDLTNNNCHMPNFKEYLNASISIAYKLLILFNKIYL